MILIGILGANDLESKIGIKSGICSFCGEKKDLLRLRISNMLICWDCLSVCAKILEFSNNEVGKKEIIKRFCIEG